MISTIQIEYQYDETQGILPSGMPQGLAFCGHNCMHLDKNRRCCKLFLEDVYPVKIGSPPRDSFTPTVACRHHEMQGR